MATEALGIRRGLSGRALGLIALIAAALFVIGRVIGVDRAPTTQTFTIIFIAIVVEALPFVLLGAVTSAAIEVFVSDDAFARLARLPLALQLPAAAFGGFAFPVCECGSVPVARRLIKRGMHPSAGIAFMLASPIFNPIVLSSTWIAYKARGLGTEMVIGRAALGFVLALIVGWTLGGEGAAELLRIDQEAADEPIRHDTARGAAFVGHFTHDFFFMGKFLIAGAALSGALQTMIPQSMVSGVARTPVIGSLALMAVAFIASLCSEADAFVAVSFTQFPLGAQLAFLVFGPVLDFKLAFLYTASYKKRFAFRLAVVAVPVVLAGALWFEAVIR